MINIQKDANLAHLVKNSTQTQNLVYSNHFKSDCLHTTNLVYVLFY